MALILQRAALFAPADPPPLTPVRWLWSLPTGNERSPVRHRGHSIQLCIACEMVHCNRNIALHHIAVDRPARGRAAPAGPRAGRGRSWGIPDPLLDIGGEIGEIGKIVVFSFDFR